MGTHALTENSKSTLWGRLAQHRGSAQGKGGNHRGSIFRLLVGAAIGEQKIMGAKLNTWGQKSDVGKAALKFGISRAEVKQEEALLERVVSNEIGLMPFLWLDINDAPGLASLRGYVERNSIALLSNYGKPPLDSPSASWLGHFCDRKLVRQSGLWNNNHVAETYASDFIHKFWALIQEMESEVK